MREFKERPKKFIRFRKCWENVGDCLRGCGVRGCKLWIENENTRNWVILETGN